MPSVITEKRIICCQNLWKIYGPDPDRIIDNNKHGKNKQQILEETGHVIAVKDVSFNVYENEVFVIMGLSGSGKSTLVRCLNRLVEPTRGKVLIDGIDIEELNHTELKELRRYKMSMVFQSFGLLPHISVLDNIALGLQFRHEKKKLRREKAMQVLDIVGLKGWEKNHIYELSGGMQQRVGLARALAVESDIVLMDEPFSALDPLIRRQMQDEFINLRSTVKKTVVFITHDLLEALKLGDRIGIMRDGEIVQLGTPEDIVTKPADDYVREFVQDVPAEKAVSIETAMEDPEVVIRDNEDTETAINNMLAKRATLAFVTDAHDRLIGVVTLHRAIHQSKRQTVAVKDIAKRDLPSVSLDSPLDESLQLVAKTGMPVPVLDKNQRILGVITEQALIKVMQKGTSSPDPSAEG